MTFGQTCAYACRPTRIARCCKQTPASPEYSMMRAFSGSIASATGLTDFERRDRVGRVDERKGWNGQCGRADRRLSDLQGSSAEAVFTIEPFDDLADELARQRHLVECPAFNARVNVHCAGVGDTECGVHQPRPNECAGRRKSAHIRQYGTCKWIAVGKLRGYQRHESVPELVFLWLETQWRSKQYQAAELLGAAAAYRAASVPPSECPIRYGS